LHDVVQLAGGKLPNRLRHSRAAHDHAHWNNRDLKRDIAHGVHNGLHFEPARMSDDLLPRILPNRKIKRAAVRFLYLSPQTRTSLGLNEFQSNQKLCSIPY
jgi:hypothetical protein